jgi:hypothetical protein
MPADVKSSVGSSRGTIDDDGTTRCARLAKNSMNWRRISADRTKRSSFGDGWAPCRAP